MAAPGRPLYEAAAAAVDSLAATPPTSPPALHAWLDGACATLGRYTARLQGHPPDSRAPPLGLKDTAQLAALLDACLATCALGQVDAGGAPGGAPPGARWVRTRARVSGSSGVPEATMMAAALATAPGGPPAAAAVAARAVAAATPILLSPWVDARQKDRSLPDLLAACFQLARWGGSGAGGGDAAPASAVKQAAAQGQECLRALLSELPSRTTARALLQLLWGQTTAGCVLVTPGEGGGAGQLLWAPQPPTSADVGGEGSAPSRGSTAPPSPASAAAGPAAAGALSQPPPLPRWLCLCASTELARITLRAPPPTADGGGAGSGGVEAVLDAIFDAIDVDNPIAVDRAVLLAADVLATPPLELTGSADAYLSAVGPQLRRLLRLGGHRSDVLVTAASLALARIAAAASDKDTWAAALNHVLKPLARPLVAFGDPPPAPPPAAPAAATHLMPAQQQPPAPSPAPAAAAAVADPPARRRPLITVLGEDSQPPAAAPPARGEDGLAAAPAPAGVIVLADADAVAGAVADLHRLLFIAPPTARTAAALLFAVPGLLDLMGAGAAAAAAAGAHAGGVRLPPAPGSAPDAPAPPDAAAMAAPAATGFARLARDVCCRILAAAPPGWAVATLLRCAGLEGLVTTASGPPGSLDAVMAAAPAVRVGAPGVRFEVDAAAGAGGMRPPHGGSAAFRLVFDPAAAEAAASAAPPAAKPASIGAGGSALAELLSIGSAAPGGGTEGSAAGDDVGLWIPERTLAALLDVLGAMPPPPRTRKASAPPAVGVSEGVYLRLLRAYADAQAAALRAGAVMGADGDDDNGHDDAPPGADPPTMVRCLQLLLAMTEALGPAALFARSGSCVGLVQALRPLLALLVAAVGATPAPPAAAGCTGAAARIAEEEDARAREAPPPQPSSDAHTVVDAANVLLHLLSAVAQHVSEAGAPPSEGGAAAGLDDGASGDGALLDVDAEGLAGLAGAARPVAGAAPPPRDPGDIAAIAWLQSCLPLVAALADAAPRVAADAALEHAAQALRFLLLSLPVEEGEHEGGGASTPSPDTGGGRAARRRLPAAGGAAPTAPSAAFAAALQAGLELASNDASPPLVAHGLRRLARLVRAGPAELREPPAGGGSSAEEDGTLAATIARLVDAAVAALMRHEGGGAGIGDAFVGLAAVELLSMLGARHARRVLPRLVELACPAAPGALATTPAAVCLRCGEALAAAVRSLGAGRLLPAHAHRLLPQLLETGARGWRAQEALWARLREAAATAGQADAGAPSPSEQDSASPGDRMELSMEEVGALAGGRVPPSLAALAGVGGSGSTDAAAAAAHAAAHAAATALLEWTSLRVSALSVLGDVGGGLGEALGGVSGALLSGLGGVLRHERGPPPPPPQPTAPDAGATVQPPAVAAAWQLANACATQLRRAAALALRLALDGIASAAGGGGASAIPAGELAALVPLLRDAAEGDGDAVTRAHAGDALVAARAALLERRR